jgi:membrane protein implicated in regulation of membrane protease activity
VFTIISAFSAHVLGGHGGDSDLGTGGHAEAGFDHSGMPGISAFSPTTLAAFVTSFGGLGIIFSRVPATREVYLSVPLATVGGLGIAAGVFFAFKAAFQKTQSSSESRVATLVGQTATLLTPIPRDGVGEIAYVQAGTRYTAPARSERGVAIASGQTVRISRIVGTQFFVESI